MSKMYFCFNSLSPSLFPGAVYWKKFSEKWLALNFSKKKKKKGKPRSLMSNVVLVFHSFAMQSVVRGPLASVVW